ncbi:hypothetical protein Dred_0084 [Desulforamulus reducens MI-1]|uniref:Uncharacterized protein n=1 Tax=Desulforamulus reducens (strain ATCC BAA-1160 / DSM 100696 / MI-1) TaxID=349161 RepID=A4J0N1_DESRM|nr:hypothetical protein Dred_0084 [Desulforamulus reducens MI-1]
MRKAKFLNKGGEELNNTHEMNGQEQNTQTLKTADEVLYQGLEGAMFKLLNFQAQQGADQNSTMIMLALMNLLGVVNCMNRILPEGQRVRGTTDLAGQIAGMLGGVAPPTANSQGVPGQSQPSGIDPGMIAALASMLGGPSRPEGAGEAGSRPGLDPAMMAALASMLSGPGGGGGANTAALMALLANMLGPKRPMEGTKPPEQPVKTDKVVKTEEKPKQTKEQGPAPKGILKWDSRFGAPSSSF